MAIPIRTGGEPVTLLAANQERGIRMHLLVRLAAWSVVLWSLPLASLAVAQGNGAGGVSGPAFYVDGVLYRTVGTPTDFSGTGAPAHSFDTIYAFPTDANGMPVQPNVATAAPGDPCYNGGRWRVMVLTFANYEAAVGTYDGNASGDLDSDEEVQAAIMGGAATTSAGPSFECPVIPVPRGGQS